MLSFAFFEKCVTDGRKDRRTKPHRVSFRNQKFFNKKVTFAFPHQVTKMLGNGRLEAMCFDGTKRLCHIRGKLRKKVWINQSDIILIGLRDYQVHWLLFGICLRLYRPVSFEPSIQATPFIGTNSFRMERNSLHL